MKKSGDMSLGACNSSGSGKRKAKPAEELPDAKHPSLSLVACTASVQGESVPMDVDEIEDEEWEHTFWSESSSDEEDEDEDDEEKEEEEEEEAEEEEEENEEGEDEREKFEEFVRAGARNVEYCDEEQIQDLWFHYRFHQNFVISDEKRNKLKQQNKRRVDFTLELNSRRDITKDSCSDEVFEKLKREGPVMMPKKYALPLIQDVIERKVDFHELELCFDLIKQLLYLVPCVQVENSMTEVTEYLHKAGLAGNLPEIIIDRAIVQFRYTIHNLEVSGWFHPVIRKDRIEEYFTRLDRRCKMERCKMTKRWKRETPLAYAEYIKQKEEQIISSKEYQDALRDVGLHQEFHKHVGSCNFIVHNMTVEELLEDERVVKTRFNGLDKSLLESTLKEWLSLLQVEHEYTTFKSWLKGLARERVEEGCSSMDEVLDEIRSEHPNFPQLSDKWIYTNVQDLPVDWTDDQKEEELSLFHELMREVRKCTNCHVSDAYLIEGIFDYSFFRSWIERCPEEFENEKDKFSIDCTSTLASCRRTEWNDAFYDHPVYKTIYEDESTIIC